MATTWAWILSSAWFAFRLDLARIEEEVGARQDHPSLDDGSGADFLARRKPRPRLRRVRPGHGRVHLDDGVRGGLLRAGGDGRPGGRGGRLLRDARCHAVHLLGGELGPSLPSTWSRSAPSG